MTYLLAHLSDAHIGPLPKTPLRQILNKRFTGYVNWKRRSRIHSMPMLAKLVEDMLEQQPDHVAMTGDILNLGLPGEFPFARTWLETLGESDNVSFVPGNHDAYLRSSLLHIGETFGPWCSNDGDERTVFPYLRVREEIALIGLSSAIPTGPFLASGRVGEKQMREFRTILEETGRLGLCRVVMIHHPPWRGATNPGRGLRDASGFEKAIAECGAELVLHGHNHRRMTKMLPGPSGPVPVVGVASASAVPGSDRHLAEYHLYEIARAGNRWSIEGRVRGVAEAGRQITGLGDIELV
ncbi:MAG: metallophosphoesterase [Hyphomicrobiales bacterium]|nr:metallophosphoesterase [Hyphomicrobiales bacterium]